MKNIISLILFILLFTSPADAVDWTNAKGKWALNEYSVTDLSGNGNDLIAVNTPGQADGHDGGTNAAADCEVSSMEYFKHVDDADFDITGNLSISAWIRLEQIGVYHQIVTKWNTTGNQRSYRFYIDGATDKLWFAISNDGSSSAFCKGATALVVDTWYHVAVVYNGTDIRIYLDGSVDTNGADNPKTYSSGGYNSTAELRIGFYDGATHYLDGRIDDVAIWADDLTDIEISELYSMTDDFASSYGISGVLKDRAGNVIDCSSYGVDIYVYDVDDGSLVKSGSCAAADGTWSIAGGLGDSLTKYAVMFLYEGLYGPLEVSDIAGAEFMITDEE